MTRTRKKFLLLALLLLGGAGVIVSYRALTARQPQAPTQIFDGITYSCERLPETAESSGLAHLVRVELTRPGIELFVTPLDSHAQARGGHYRLKWASTVCDEERLAVVVNGARFRSGARFLPTPGDIAATNETVISEHVVNPALLHLPLIWFDDSLSPHVCTESPVPKSVMKQARFGVGVQAIAYDGEWCERWKVPDALTFIGIDESKKLLWLACFENASPKFCYQWMREKGIPVIAPLDGGSSTTMVIGSGAHQTKPGTLLQGWIPVASHFGVKASALPSTQQQPG